MTVTEWAVVALVVLNVAVAVAFVVVVVVPARRNARIAKGVPTAADLTAATADLFAEAHATGRVPRR